MRDKMMQKRIFVFSALVLFALGVAFADNGSEIIALKGAKIHTAAGPAIENGIILIDNGKILALGKDIAIPSGARIIDVSGKEIIPGLIDEHSHIGVLYRGANEFVVPIGPDNMALDSLDLEDADWYEACKGGVTTVITGPGSGEQMGGQSVTIKTFGKDRAKRFLKANREMKIALNSRNLSHLPSLRKTFIKAREYAEAWDRWAAGGKTGPAPERDLGLEAVVPLIKGEEKIRCHIHYAADMMTMLKLKDDFGLDLTFIHSSESYKVAPEIAKRKVPVIALPLADRIAVSDDVLFGIRNLWRAGVKVCLHTDHPVVHERIFRICASMMVHYGVPEEEALKMETINPAESSKIAARVGSLEPGKDADIIVLNGTWFEPRSRVDMVFVDGVLAYDRAKDNACAKTN